MPRKTDAADELARRLIQALEDRRAAGDYPLPLRRLAELADPQATPEQVAAAVKKTSFKGRALAALPRSDATPVALREDVDRLAESPLLLEAVLELVCTDAARTHPVSKLKAKVPADLKKPFEAAVNRLAREDALPPAVGAVVVRGRPQLFLKRLPPLPPPEARLAEKLVRALEAQRQLGGDAYPLPLQRLLELTEPDAGPTLVNKAVAAPPFAARAVLARAKDRAAPVALRDDLPRLAASPLLLDYAVRVTRTETTRAFSAPELGKKIGKDVGREFVRALADWPETALPAGVGWLLVKGRRLFFLLEDVGRSREPSETLPPPVPPGSRDLPSGTDGFMVPPGSRDLPGDFARAFGEAFDRLDRQRGGHNFVSLVELRRAVPCDRAAFDAGLRRLRVAGQYTLSAAEGRHGISPEEQQAGITEEGSLLLFVSRRSP
ncbi:MAG TPA: hypothetical protein VFA26_10990 [Gemmataceae bacterium]|nr:hypothetical protein [Gemmataceae bacterium]